MLRELDLKGADVVREKFLGLGHQQNSTCLLVSKIARLVLVTPWFRSRRLTKFGAVNRHVLPVPAQSTRRSTPAKLTPPLRARTQINCACFVLMLSSTHPDGLGVVCHHMFYPFFLRIEVHTSEGVSFTTMVELEPQRRAKDKLVQLLTKQGITEGYTVAVSFKGIDVRVLDKDTGNACPNEIDGISVNVRTAELPKMTPQTRKKKKR